MAEERPTPPEDIVFRRATYEPDHLVAETEEGSIATHLNGTWALWNTALTNSTSSTNGVDVIWRSWVVAAPTTNVVDPVDFTQRYEVERTYRYGSGWDGPYIQSRYDPVPRPPQPPLEVDAEDRHERADALLRELLTRKQRASFDKDGQFIVIGSRKGRYLLGRYTTPALVQNVGGEERVLERLCIHPSGYPRGDTLAAQKLLLETDEAEFRRIANITPVG